jgi:hypothetical protein
MTTLHYVLDMAPCIACRRITSRANAATVEDFHGSEVFLCKECQADFDRADKQADLVAASIEHNGGRAA